MHKLLLTNAQISRFCKAFGNNSSANIKLSKTNLHKVEKLGGFSVILLGLVLKIRLPLIGDVLKPLAKSVLIPLGLTVAASPTDSAIHKKMFRLGMTTLIISNEEMDDIMKIIKSLEESALLIKEVSETIKNKAKTKNKKEGF